MTKRFTMNEDGYIWDNKEPISQETVLDKLNELHEEKEQLQHDATILIQSNQDYRRENEQLKCGNKNLKATLNDFINICNRLQANPTDKQTLSVARDMLQNMGKELKE